MSRRFLQTLVDTSFLVAFAISLTCLVCLIVCVLKRKYGMAIVGFVTAVAQEIGLPPIGGILESLSDRVSYVEIPTEPHIC